MIRRGANDKASLYVLLQLTIIIIILLHSTVLVCSLSISPSSSNTKNSLTSSRNIQPNSYTSSSSSSSSSSSTGGQQTTLPPPLITTIAHNNYLDSLATQLQAAKQPTAQDISSTSAAVNEQQQQLRSTDNQEHDDSVPLATINNHSRNNQPVARPPQYVDVSALVGRDRGSSSSSNNNTSSSLVPALGSNGASGLTPKSRSGLPECATQQVCNAIFVRMNYTQKLCECSSSYNWKCSNNLDPQDGHTIELTRKFDKRIYTQIKTCEPLREVRACKSPTDWTLLALQSERSGKAHYVVVCKCPTWAQLEGPYTHNHPPYANIPGIRVYGMLCAHQTARSSAQTYASYNPALSIYPDFPWPEALNVLNTTNLLTTLDSAHH